MADAPLLTIVIANYNYGRFLEEAICSVLSQLGEKSEGVRAGDVELIVVDGGSTDNSVEVIKKYENRIAWWVSETDGGQSNAFNKGFGHANGKYLTWLNADDVLVPGALVAIVGCIRKHPACEWFTGNAYRFTEDRKVCEVCWGPHVYPSWLQRRHSPVVVFGPSSVFARDLWLRVGKIDEDIHLMMDTDLWIRFMIMGVKQRRINHFIWAFRMHADSKTAEYGDHKLSDARRKQFADEIARSNAKTGYKSSSFMHGLILIWRLLDGSLVKRAFLKRRMVSI